MQKAIYIEPTDNNIAAVLSIGPAEMAPTWNGRTYILIDDYHEPELTDPMDKAYPVYNKADKKFNYLIEHWTITAQQDCLDIANLKADYAKAIAQASATQEEMQRAVMELTTMIASVGGGADAMPEIPMPPTGV